MSPLILRLREQKKTIPSAQSAFIEISKAISAQLTTEYDCITAYLQFCTA